MLKEIIHALSLIITIIIAFAIPQTNLANYDLQIGAVLFIILFMAKKFFIPRSSRSRLLESIVFSLIILLTINTTGGTNSPFFFLLYFLLFSLSLLLEPIISLTTTGALIIFFLLNLPPHQDLKHLLPIISLAFLTPFAMLLGQEYIENEKLKVKTQKEKENTFLFLSLMVKNHLKSIKQAVENFLGDHQLHQIKHHVKEAEKLIDKFEKYDLK